MSDKISLETKIIDDIRKTGFPSEIIAGDILEKDGREVFYNVYYLDLDENKGREIDIIASTPKFNNTPSIYIEHTLVCSVKKTSKPWIVFTTNDVGFDQPAWSRIYMSLGCDAKMLSARDFDKRSTIKDFTRFGRSYYIAFKGTNTEIFDALCSSVKASEARRLLAMKWLDEEGAIGNNIIDFRLYEPLVILNGRLFEAYLDVEDKLTIQEVNHIPISFGYLSNQYKHSEEFLDYVVEIVTIDKLSDLLVNKEKWLNSLMESIIKGKKNKTK